MISNKNEIKKLYSLSLSKKFFEKKLEKKEEASPLHFFPSYSFSLEDIQYIYTFHLKKGDGLWFYLFDGSIWNEHGEYEHAMVREDFI